MPEPVDAPNPPKPPHPKLGRHVAAYGLASDPGPAALVLQLVIMVFALPGFVMAGFAVVFLVKLNLVGAFLLAAGASVFIGLGLWLRANALRGRGDRRDVYERGVAVVRQGAATTLAWDEVEAIYDDRVLRLKVVGKDQPSRFLTLIGRNGRRALFFDDECEPVSAAAYRARLPALLAHARRELAAGRPVRFGEVAVGKAGLSIGPGGSSPTRQEPWDRMDRLLYRNGELIVVHKGGSETMAALLRAVPNLAVFEKLVTEDFKMVLEGAGRAQSQAAPA